MSPPHDRPPKGGLQIQCPYCSMILNSRGAPTHIRNLHPEQYPEFMSGRKRYRGNVVGSKREAMV